MARVNVLDERKIVEVPDGSLLVELDGKTNLLFACREGVCTTCLVDVVEGKENLEEPGEMESMTLSTLPPSTAKNPRLMCVSRIKGGEVKIKYVH
ncbi:MAG: (2Fe-2S)-binding protein [Candidatus Micrarchaeota archaeon]|nr:(2Fe-2S)-binding protein [Candidatus Micrarchaeota archaeon]MCX8154409.1 (2Fe-2S)-binding protein [Candidatus Micrarchaeota archaeon]